MPNVPFSILRTDHPEVSSDRLDQLRSQARKRTANNFISTAAMREPLRPRICASKLRPGLPTETGMALLRQAPMPLSRP